MSNFFENALNSLDTLEEDILGPDYPYYKYINSPSDMGMSASGDKIATNIGGLLSYVDVLVTGSGKASATGKPLGDKYFITTAAKCKDVATGNDVTRSLYVNNVPDGSIPFITSLSGESTDLKGIVPGVLHDMVELNPLQIFQAFMIGSDPDCQQVTLETIDVNNVSTQETGYLINTDIQSMNPCWFTDSINPITKIKCKESFATVSPCSNKPPSKQTKLSRNEPDLYVQLYYGSLGLVGLYIFMKLILK